MDRMGWEEVLRRHRDWLDRVPGGRRADLRQVKLVRACLAGLDFTDAICTDTVFTGADLRDARFARANLRYAVFAAGDLRGANFQGADLTFANFTDANLQGARFDGATLLEGCFDGITMSWYDNTLLSEMLWQAAGDDFEKQMVAAFVGRKKAWCWDDFLHIPAHHRLWMVKYFRDRVKPGDDAPAFYKAREERLERQRKRVGE